MRSGLCTSLPKMRLKTKSVWGSANTGSMERSYRKTARYTEPMSAQETLDQICADFGLSAVYLFGSRRDDGLRRLRGEAVSGEGSDLDVGVVFRDPGTDPRPPSPPQGHFEEIFAPLRVAPLPPQPPDALCPV